MKKITITGKKGRVLTSIKMPDDTRVSQISWTVTGEVDEISFQFDGSGMDLVDLENDHPRLVGFTAPEHHDEVEDEEDEVDDED